MSGLVLIFDLVLILCGRVARKSVKGTRTCLLPSLSLHKKAMAVILNVDLLENTIME